MLAMLEVSLTLGLNMILNCETSETYSTMFICTTSCVIYISVLLFDMICCLPCGTPKIHEAISSVWLMEAAVYVRFMDPELYSERCWDTIEGPVLSHKCVCVYGHWVFIYDCDGRVDSGGNLSECSEFRIMLKSPPKGPAARLVGSWLSWRVAYLEPI